MGVHDDDTVSARVDVIYSTIKSNMLYPCSYDITTVSTRGPGTGPR